MVSVPALAQQTNSPIPHEFFVYSEQDLGDGGAALPEIPQPGLAVEANPDGESPLIFTADGPQFSGPLDDPGLGGQDNAPSSSTSPVRLDRDTDREGMLRYAAVYEPSVTPFKRMGARDAVRLSNGEYEIGLSDDRLSPVPIGRSPADDADVFVGRMTLRASGGRAIPLPSVAPNMRVHQVATSPPVAVEILVDGADNYFLRSDADGDVDVEWTVSAPRSYFGGEVTDNGRRSRPDDLTPQHARDAELVIDSAGVRSSMSDAERIEVLVEYFRAFDARPFPESLRSDNLYLDIALSQLGVCRHRAQAFVITAAALGIESRYVYNEAHAFVEVEVPGQGWRRVDLGGAAQGLEVFGEDEPEPHDPGDDPWGYEGTLADEVGEPQSQTYAQSGSGDSQTGSGGEPDDESAETATDHASGTEEIATSSDPGGSEEVSQATDAEGGNSEEESGSAPIETMEFEPRRFADLPPGPEGGAVDEETEEATDEPPLIRMRTSLRFDVEQDRVYRGSAITVSGRLLDAEDRSAGPAEISLYLGPADESRADEPVMRLGSAQANEEGWFQATVDIPATTPVGSWGVYAVYTGGPGYEPSRSQ